MIDKIVEILEFNGEIISTPENTYDALDRSKYEQVAQEIVKLFAIPDVSNLLPLDNCIVEWEKFVKQHNLKGNAGQISVYFGIFLHGWRGRNSEGFWQ